MNIVLQYLDTENKKRWGYITSKTMERFMIYHKQLKQSEEDSDNEVLKKTTEIMGEEKIELFLLDGRTGSSTLKACSIVPSFAKNDNV